MALVFSIEFNIPYGAWILKGRRPENSLLPGKYRLEEMPTSSYPKRTERNVMDSDGTLIISRDLPTGGIAYTIEMARKHRKPYILINLNETSGLDAPSIISTWAAKQGVEVLNVAGPRACEDSGIYRNVRNIIEKLYHT